MKINCHNTFDLCKEVIVGDVNKSLLDTIENKNKRFILEDVIEETKEDLNDIQKILESFGTKVHRPDITADFSKKITTPYFETQGWHLPLTPRDIFYVYEDTLVVTAPMDRNRYFEHHPYQNILQHYFDEGSHVISMPFPALDDGAYENVEIHHNYFNNEFPMAAAANLMKYGKDIIVSDVLSANEKGIEWIRRQMGDGYRFRTLPTNLAGHVDGLINILKPGVVASIVGKSLLPDFFKNWEVICLEEIDPRRIRTRNVSLVTDNLQDDDFEGSFLGCNMFSIDQEYVILNSFTEKTILQQLEKQNITPIFSDIRHFNFLNQGHTCCILDTVRDSKLEDYS